MSPTRWLRRIQSAGADPALEHTRWCGSRTLPTASHSSLWELRTSRSEMSCLWTCSSANTCLLSLHTSSVAVSHLDGTILIADESGVLIPDEPCLRCARTASQRNIHLAVCLTDRAAAAGEAPCGTADRFPSLRGSSHGLMHQPPTTDPD